MSKGSSRFPLEESHSDITAEFGWRNNRWGIPHTNDRHRNNPWRCVLWIEGHCGPVFAYLRLSFDQELHLWDFQELSFGHFWHFNHGSKRNGTPNTALLTHVLHAKAWGRHKQSKIDEKIARGAAYCQILARTGGQLRIAISQDPWYAGCGSLNPGLLVWGYPTWSFKFRR